MELNMNQWIDEIIAAKQKKGFLVLSFPAVQKLGCTVNDLVTSSELQTKAMKIVADETPDALACVSMMDLSIEAEAFGATPKFDDAEIPTIVGRLVASEEDAENLKVPEIGAGRTSIYIDAIKMAVELINDRPVLAGTIGPFSLAGRLMDVSEIMIECYEDPDTVHVVLGKATEFLIEYIRAYKAAGANGVLLAEPLAGLLSPAFAAEFSCDYVKKIIDAVQDDHFCIAYHNCGNAALKQIHDITAMGSRILHFGNAVNMADVMPHIPANIIAMGNLDPAGQLKNGTPESVKEKTLDILKSCSQYPNFVISSGCDIPPSASWDNIHAFWDAVKEFNTAL